MNVVYKYRIYPTKEQECLLNSWLEESTFLWNQSIVFREEKWGEYIKQYGHLDKKDRPKFKFSFEKDLLQVLIRPYATSRKIQMYSHVRDNIVYRLEESYKSFFKGICKKPKLYKPNETFESIEYSTIRVLNKDTGKYSYMFKFKDHNRNKIDTNNLDINQVKYIYIPSLKSDIRIVMHRYFDIGTLTSIRIKKESSVNEWYACFTISKQFNSPHPSENIVGIDKGLTDVLNFSDNIPIVNNGIERFTSSIKNVDFCNPKIEKLKRKLSKKWEINFYTCSQCKHWCHENRRKVKNSYIGAFKCIKCGNVKFKWDRKNYGKLSKKISKLMKEDVRKRENYYHHISKSIAENNSVIGNEDLLVTNMQKNKRVAGGIQKVAWSKLDNMIKYKVEFLNGLFLKIPPQYTSMTCNNCGHCEDGNRRGKNFKCLICGHVDDADINAAKNIRDVVLQMLTCPECNRIDIGNIKSESVESFKCVHCGHERKTNMSNSIADLAKKKDEKYKFDLEKLRAV